MSPPAIFPLPDYSLSNSMGLLISDLFVCVCTYVRTHLRT